MLNIVLDQSQKLKELDYSLPKFELPTELYEFEETLSKLKEMTSDLLSKTISCIDSELISKRECLIQNLIETEEKIEPEKLFDNICMRNIEIKESLKVIAGSLEAVTDYTSSLKIVNSLIESKEDFAPFTAKDVDSLFSAYSKMHRAFNEDHIATYGLFISVETLKDVSHSFSKEAILEQEESKKKSIRALDEQIDSFMEKLKLKESYLKEFVNFVKEETQLIESKVDDAFKLLGFKFKRFNYVLQQAKLISQAKKEEESLSKQYKEKIAEIDEKEFEIEKLKLEIKFSQRKGKAATDIQIEKLNALVESHRLLLTSKEFTQLKLKLWEVSFFIPEIILRFPEIYPLYGTKAADLPLMILEKDYNDVENMELGKKNIFLAKRKVDDKKVVLKKYKISLDNEFKLLRKWANFIGLIKFPGSISLTAIVTSTALENRGNIFLEMPYFKKGNLKNWMEANTEISSFQKGAIIHEIAKSLNILHENDIIHRDIKPENILMSDDDKPILADFDFAKQLSTSLLEQEISSSSVFQGSPGYLAPELFRTPETFKHSKASDCFAFGVIVAQLILNEFIVSLDDIHMPTPSPERDLIFGLLHPNPSKRWDLKQVLNNEFVKLRIICTVCLEYRDQENLIGCNMANDYGSSHFLCRVPCFNAYVLSFCNNLENIFMETNGNIPCISGANSCKHYFSDRMVIANCSDSTSMEYLNMKKRLLEKQIYTKFESEYQQRLEIEAKKIASMNAFEREVNRYRNIILESFNLKCPRCHLVFVDFEGCFALSCFRCGCGFCAWCLKDCGSDAHRHVTRCPMNLISGKEVFGTMDQWKKARTKILKGTIQTQLLEITDLRLRSEVYKSLEILFKEKEINLDIPIAG